MWHLHGHQPGRRPQLSRWKHVGHYLDTSPDSAQVVTDLADSWHVLWFDGGRLCQGPCEHWAHAVNFISTFLAGGLAEEEGGQAIANRQKIQDRLIPRHAG